MAEPILGQFYDSLYSFLFINFILSADNKSAVERANGDCLSFVVFASMAQANASKRSKRVKYKCDEANKSIFTMR